MATTTISGCCFCGGVRFEFTLVEGLHREEAKRLYERADLFVDQLILGWYGGVAVELMALGKPVIAHIRPGDGIGPQPGQRHL